MNTRWTMAQLAKMTNEQFTVAILNERLNRLTNPYSPLAVKLRAAKAAVTDNARKAALFDGKGGQA
jgi:hypothetical protein